MNHFEDLIKLQILVQWLWGSVCDSAGQPAPKVMFVLLAPGVTPSQALKYIDGCKHLKARDLVCSQQLLLQ